MKSEVSQSVDSKQGCNAYPSLAAFFILTMQHAYTLNFEVVCIPFERHLYSQFMFMCIDWVLSNRATSKYFGGKIKTNQQSFS